MKRKRAKKLLMAMGYSRNFAEYALTKNMFRFPNDKWVQICVDTREYVYRQFISPHLSDIPIGRWFVPVNFIPGLGCKPQITIMVEGKKPW